MVNCLSVRCLYVCAALGASYGTAKSGTGIAAMAVMRPELIMKSIIPVVMAGIIAIYGLVVSVLIASGITSPETGYDLFKYASVFISTQNKSPFQNVFECGNYSWIGRRSSLHVCSCHPPQTVFTFEPVFGSGIAVVSTVI